MESWGIFFCIWNLSVNNILGNAFVLFDVLVVSSFKLFYNIPVHDNAKSNLPIHVDGYLSYFHFGLLWIVLTRAFLFILLMHIKCISGECISCNWITRPLCMSNIKSDSSKSIEYRPIIITLHFPIIDDHIYLHLFGLSLSFLNPVLLFYMESS